MSKDTLLVVTTTICLALVGGMGTLVVYLVKVADRWGRVETKLENLIMGVKALVDSKDRSHAELVATLRDDRAANNDRLTKVEDWLWRKPKM